MSIVPLPGCMVTDTLTMAAIWPAQAPAHETTKRGVMRVRLPERSSRRVAAERPRIRDVRLDELPGLHGAVRQLEGAPDGRVQGRLAPQRLGDRDLLAIDVGRCTGRREGRDVVVGVGRGGDEEATGVLDAGRRDVAEDAVLGDALLDRKG